MLEGGTEPRSAIAQGMDVCDVSGEKVVWLSASTVLANQRRLSK
jgi:hypothetical protein